MKCGHLPDHVMVGFEVNPGAWTILAGSVTNPVNLPPGVLDEYDLHSVQSEASHTGITIRYPGANGQPWADGAALAAGTSIPLGVAVDLRPAAPLSLSGTSLAAVNSRVVLVFRRRSPHPCT